ncbi:MAG: shikimate kinase [Eubacteriales bacterium]|nr:shikimate kinase [Eubacteriales bacterium]
MNNKNGNIVLIGFMGCGKTTFGKWISEHYNMDFVDTDEYIEGKYKRLIRDIFSEDGEETFRDMETEAVKELGETLENTVVSVGGGLPLRKINQELLKKTGIVVYLETSKEELVRRLKNDDTRPLLQGCDLQERIDSLMKQREDIYKSAADMILPTDGLSFEEMYRTIMGIEGITIF